MTDESSQHSLLEGADACAEDKPLADELSGMDLRLKTDPCARDAPQVPHSFILCQCGSN